MSLHNLSRLISRLEKWVEKREARRLESQALIEAIRALREYQQILAARRAA